MSTTATKTKTLVCSNPKKYHLTKGANYEVVKKAGGRVTIKNDLGLTRAYDISLFKDKPAEPTLLTDQQIFDSVSIIEDNSVIVQNRRGDTLTLENHFSINGSNLSCGVRDLIGLSGPAGVCRNIVNLQFQDNRVDTAEFKAELERKLYLNLIKAIVNDDQTYLWVLASVNNNASDFDIIDDVLGQFVITDAEGRNPNTDNNIVLWILDRSAILAAQ